MHEVLSLQLPKFDDEHFAEHQLVVVPEGVVDVAHWPLAVVQDAWSWQFQTWVCEHGGEDELGAGDVPVLQAEDCQTPLAAYVPLQQ